MYTPKLNRIDTSESRKDRLIKIIQYLDIHFNRMKQNIGDEEKIVE